MQWPEKQFGEKEHTATTWYEPFNQADKIQQAVNFALSYEVTGLCTAGDVRTLPLILKACANFQALDAVECEKLIKSGAAYQPLFA